MVSSPVGSSDLSLILGCMTSNFLYLSFSTLRSSSLWRADTIVYAKLNNSPPPPLSNKLSLNVLEIKKSAQEGLVEDLL